MNWNSCGGNGRTKIQKPDTLIFDLDDTLVNFTEFAIEKYIAIAKKLNLKEQPVSKIRENWYSGLDNLIKTVWTDANLDEFKRQVEKDVVGPYDPVPGGPEALKTLKKLGIRLAVLTTTPKYSLFEKLDTAGYNRSIFEDIKTTDGFSITKPSPQIFSLLRKDLLKGKCFYVGDNLLDLKSARSSSIGFIAVLSGSTSRKQFEDAGASIILDSIANLVNIWS